MSVELLQREIEHLRGKQKPKSRKAKSGHAESLVANLFASATSEQEVLLLVIEHVLSEIYVYETDIFVYDSSHHLVSTTANQTNDKLGRYVKDFEENGICDWISENKTASIIPNLDDIGNDNTISSFLIIPLMIRDSTLGFTIARTNIQSSQCDPNILNSVTEQSYYAALAIDNLRSQAEISKMNAKLQNFSKSLSTPQEATSISEITNSISEEIANSLKIVNANIALIESGVGNSKQRINTIKQQFDLINLLNNKLIKISAHTSEQAKETFSFAEVVEDVLLFSNSQLQRDGIIVYKTIEPENIIINGIKAKLEQALLNILLFSRDKLEEGGKIEITLYSTRNKRANLIITDNSIGLNASEEATILEHYVVNPNKQQRINGLYLANKIIENHNGKLEVISELGKGITYKVALPIYQPKG